MFFRFWLRLWNLYQCHIQSYFEAGIPVWDPKLRPPNSHKCWLISGVSFRHCSLSQSHESDVSSLFRMQNSQKFLGLCPWTPLGRAYRTPKTTQLHNVFLFATLIEKPAPPKNWWIQHCVYLTTFKIRLTMLCNSVVWVHSMIFWFITRVVNWKTCLLSMSQGKTVWHLNAKSELNASFWISWLLRDAKGNLFVWQVELF